MQATRGQLEVLGKREPIDEVLLSPETPAELSRKLELVNEARQFSVDILKLPDNDSYRTYSDVERDYVVWNVFAAPEFALDAKQWCYPIVGCVAYRGYFSEDAANKKAGKLRKQGYDVVVGGVPAYSTLGNFDDPVLNTMLHWDDVRLVSTLFHELAHQVLYIKDDTGFNESFATAVEEIGIEKWLAANGKKGDMTRYRERKERYRELIELVRLTRKDLRELYSSDVDEEAMRVRKAQRFEQLKAEVVAVLERDGLPTRHWLTRELNNARLLPMALYDGRVPAFRALYAECAFNLECFYAEAEAISDLKQPERDARLDELMPL
jgi:predicted aminopeptidase